MEKARLTREAADALNKLYEDGFKPEVIVARHANVEWLWESGHLNDLNLDQVCRAVYVGVEEEGQVVTVTAAQREGLLKALRYPMGKELEQWDEGFAAGMKSTLEQLGIAIKGITE